MDTSALWILIVMAALVVAGIVGWSITQRRRHAMLQSRFGPEYFRAVEQNDGDRRKAEAALRERADRVAKFHIRPLRPEERARFADAWTAVQARFVDDPVAAVNDADKLVTDLMRTRGYPMVDFETRAADLSVDHSRVVEHYRAARRIADRSSAGEASTEELRRAVVHYRVLFSELLETADTDVPVGVMPQA